MGNAQLSYNDKQILSDLLSEKINSLRQEKGKQLLERNVDLAKAAELHSNYIAERNNLTHVQVNTEFPQPRDRVEHYNSSFTNIGENVLYTKPIRNQINKQNLKSLVIDMYRSWKNSAVHYANMISDDFKYGDFGFTFNEKSKRVFAVHVFAKKGYVVENQLSDNAFSVQPTDFTCVDLIGNKKNVVVNVGNALKIVNNEVILSYHNFKILREIIENTNDGFAIDLVEREQLLCGQDNRLDRSEIYDGVMLPPVYRDDIISKNTAKNPNRLIVSLGKIPLHLKGKSLSPNLIVIKNGKKCSYTILSRIPSRKYDLKPIDPEIYSPDIALKTKGVNGIYEVIFDFKSGQIIPVKNPIIQIDEQKIHSIDIKSFTSVDGNSKVNQELHQERANYISKFLKTKCDINSIPVYIDAKENWELCYYHIELLGLEDTLGRDKEKIKNFLAKNSDEKWKASLSFQRQSKAIIYLKGNWSIHDANHLNYNLTDALLNKDYNSANRVLADMYLQEFSNLFLNEEFILDKLFDKPELVQNVAALLLKNINFYAINNIVFYVRNWLSKPEMLSEAAQKNLLNLYTITARRLLNNWDSSTEDFAKVMHPEKVEPLFENYKNQDKVNPLFLNYHMASIEYFGQINYSPKIGESFEFITDYFRNQSKSIEDDTNLSLFFNNWSMYHMTIESLSNRFDYDELDEASTFVLVKTLTAYQSDFALESFLDIHKLAIKYNKKRWCDWVDEDFQNLRREGVKNLFCKTCNL
jgi:hypothetical protein